MQHFVWPICIFLFLSLTVHSTSQGKAFQESEEGYETLEVFVGGFYVGERVLGVQVLSIPALVQPLCLGKESKYCMSLNHQVQVKTNQESIVKRSHEATLYSNSNKDLVCINKLLMLFKQKTLSSWAESLKVSKVAQPASFFPILLNKKNSVKARLRWMAVPGFVEVDFCSAKNV